MFFLYIAMICAVAGAVVGYFAARRDRTAFVASAALAVMLFILCGWRFGAPDEWSWQQPVESAMYLVGPFTCLFLLPAVAAALTVGRWRRRRYDSAPTI